MVSIMVSISMPFTIESWSVRVNGTSDDLIAGSALCEMRGRKRRAQL
jgi:hypothetical protein